MTEQSLSKYDEYLIEWASSGLDDIPTYIINMYIADLTEELEKRKSKS